MGNWPARHDLAVDRAVKPQHKQTNILTWRSPIPDLEILFEVNLNFHIQLTIILACGIFSQENGSERSLLKYNRSGPPLSVISVQFDKEIIK